jgi:hypothetical protein
MTFTGDNMSMHCLHFGLHACLQCGGSPEAVAAARPLLTLLGKTICHVGPAGAGQVGGGGGGTRHHVV